MSNLKNIKVTTKQLAELFGVSEGYISDLVNDNRMPKDAFNQFNLFDCVKFRFAHLEKIYQDKLKKNNDETNKGRLDAANARIKEIELDKKEKQLAPVEQFGWAFANWFKIFNKGFDAIEWICKYELYLNKDQLSDIRKHIDSILTQMSEIPVNLRAQYVKFVDGYDKEININD